MKGKNLGIALLMDYYGPMLTDKQMDVMEYYYDQDLSLAEIAEHTGITRQGVRDAIKRAEAYLFEMEEKLGFVKRFGRLEYDINRMSEILTEVRELNLKRVFSRELEDYAAEMETILGDMRETDSAADKAAG